MAQFLGRIADKVGGKEAAEALEAIEKSLTEHVHEHDGEAPLGRKANILPTTNPGETQKLYVREKLFAHSFDKVFDKVEKVFKASNCKDAFLVRRGGRDGTGNDKDAVDVIGKAGNQKHRVVVCGGGGDVLAVVQSSIHLSVQHYYIFGTEPIVPKQRPSDEHLDRQALYTVGTARRSHGRPVLLSFDMVRRGGGGPVADAYTVESLPAGGFLAQKLLLVRRLGKPAALLRRGQFIDEIDGPVWDGTIAPGIDPIVVLGLVAILDEHNV